MAHLLNYNNRLPAITYTQIKMRTILLLILLVVHALASDKQQTDTTKIPKILWTYWDNGFEGASLFTKMCINNMNYYTNKSGWEFRFVSRDNYTDYISKEGQQRIKKIISNSKNDILLQNHVDIFRLFLLYENGGMWLDTNSFFVSDLSWIQNIEKESTTYNKISSDPDIITFTYNDLFGGNKSRVIDEDSGEQIYLFPGIEIWSFIAKPYSKFIKDVLQNLEYTLSVPYDVLAFQNKQKGYLYEEEQDKYFLTSNYQFQTVLQKKQKQIEGNPQKYNTKYAVDYYKIWCINALQTAFSIFQANDWTTGLVIQSIFHDSLKEKYHEKMYFIKFTGDYYPYIALFLPYIQLATCLKIVNKIEKDSIIYKYIFEPSLSLLEIQRIANQSDQLTQEKECNIFQIGQTRHFIFDATALILGISLFNYLVFLIIKKGNEGSNNKDGFFILSTNDF